MKSVNCYCILIYSKKIIQRLTHICTCTHTYLCVYFQNHLNISIPTYPLKPCFMVRIFLSQWRDSLCPEFKFNFPTQVLTLLLINLNLIFPIKLPNVVIFSASHFLMFSNPPVTWFNSVSLHYSHVEYIMLYWKKLFFPEIRNI